MNYSLLPVKLHFSMELVCSLWRWDSPTSSLILSLCSSLSLRIQGSIHRSLSVYRSIWLSHSFYRSSATGKTDENGVLEISSIESPILPTDGMVRSKGFISAITPKPSWIGSIRHGFPNGKYFLDISLASDSLSSERNDPPPGNNQYVPEDTKSLPGENQSQQQGGRTFSRWWATLTQGGRAFEWLVWYANCQMPIAQARHRSFVQPLFCRYYMYSTRRGWKRKRFAVLISNSSAVGREVETKHKLIQVQIDPSAAQYGSW